MFSQIFEKIREVLMKLLNFQFFPPRRAAFSLILRAELRSRPAHVGQGASAPCPID
jgi:hypothetical protein